ncbi:hypothetical protein GQ55_1G350600 [Panicum hallii var. hallii]|uniref:Uncharacterized protein n=1 Tax=Panicum hallii var. hallii TaxID=1504633 RepID=A0A2T7FAU6_9POAL|nr:hypothetical protein GQ55_1G350600 [Panicum hallii var. hallii]
MLVPTTSSTDGRDSFLPRLTDKMHAWERAARFVWTSPPTATVRAFRQPEALRGKGKRMQLQRKLLRHSD